MERTILIMVIALALLGCSDVKEFDAPETVNQAEQPEVAETQPEQAADAKGELEAYLETEPSFKAVYNTVSIFEGERMTSEETVTIKGDNSIRSIEGEAFYVLGDKVYLCESYEETVCYDIPQEEPPKAVDVTIPEGTAVTREEDRMVARESAECFRLTDDSGFSIDCRAEDGVLLYFTRDEGDYMVEIEATSVSRTVPDSEFELPAEPVALPEEFQNAQPAK